MAVLTHQLIESLGKTQSKVAAASYERELKKAVAFDLSDIEISEVPKCPRDLWEAVKAPYPSTLIQIKGGDFPLTLAFPSEGSNFREVYTIIVLVEQQETEESSDDKFIIQMYIKVSGGYNRWIPGVPFVTDRHMHFIHGVTDRILQLWEDDPQLKDHNNLVAEAVTELVFNFFALIACNNIKKETHKPEKWENNLRSKRRAPLISEYKTLVLHTQGTDREERGVTKVSEGIENRNSPRRHWRRGHIRKLGERGFTWVSPCLVGTGPGSIDKDYKVVA